MIEFRQKDFSVLSRTIQGAGIGLGVGSMANSKLFRPLTDKFGGSSKEDELKDLKVLGSFTVLGAAMGFLVGAGEGISKKISNRNVDDRLMSKVVDLLKQSRFKEGKDFTRDPKTANDLKTKVCLVISKISGELSLRVNMVADPGLKDATKNILVKLPKNASTSKSASDKYNDIVITTVSETMTNARLVAGIAGEYINSGFPVYLVEVG